MGTCNGGFFSRTGNDKPIYQIADHLGSVRVIKDGNGDVLHRFDYFPFGSESRVWTNGTSTPQSALRYRFGGKEIAGQKASASALAGIPAAAAGSPYLDFGARLYDPRTAAWLAPDPLSEKYYPISPYTYCAGNPVNLIDPEGKDIWEFDEYGRIVSHTEHTDADTFYLVDKDESGNYVRAFTYDSNGEVQFRSISFEYKTIQNYGFVEGAGFSFKVNSNYKGNELFKFLADNSKSEMGVVNTLDEISYVMSDLKTNSVNVTGLAIELDKAGMTVTNILHSHPSNSGASGYNKNDSKGDRFAAMRLPSSHGYVVDHLIYLPKTEELVLFTKDKSGRLTTWDMWNLK